MFWKLLATAALALAGYLGYESIELTKSLKPALMASHTDYARVEGTVVVGDMSWKISSESSVGAAAAMDALRAWSALAQAPYEQSNK